MIDKKSSNYSLESDTVELFSRDDIRALRRNRYKKTYRNYSALIIALVLIIGISTIILIKFSFGQNHINLVDLNSNQNHSINGFYEIDSYIIPETERSTINSRIVPKNSHLISQCDKIEDKDKFDCNPDQPISQEVCQSRGCCWSPSKANNTNSYNNLPLNVPFCYYGNNYVGYEVNNIERDLYRTIVTLNRKIASGFRSDSQIIKLEIIELNDYSLRYLITLFC
jgi:hypothetical protein